MQIERDEISGRDTTGHEWDGIRELDTPVPKPVLLAYAFTVTLMLGWWLLYPSLPLGPDFFRGLIGTTSRERVLEDVGAAKAVRDAFGQELVEGDPAVLVLDPGVRARHEKAAAVLFADNCAACHGTDLRGQRNFPDLVDEASLFGQDPEEVEWTIRYGINAGHDDSRYNEMPAFGRDGLLEGDALKDVTEYVLSLSGRDEDRQAAFRGEEIFIDNCASCHGDDARGLGIGAPDLTDAFWIYGGDRASVRATLEQGRAGLMPSWEGRLDEAEIRKLALYLQWQRMGQRMGQRTGPHAGISGESRDEAREEGRDGEDAG